MNIRMNNLIKLIIIFSLITITCVLSSCATTNLHNDNQCNYRLELSCIDNFKFTLEMELSYTYHCIAMTLKY